MSPAEILVSILFVGSLLYLEKKRKSKKGENNWLLINTMLNRTIWLTGNDCVQ